MEAFVLVLFVSDQLHRKGHAEDQGPINIHLLIFISRSRSLKSVKKLSGVLNHSLLYFEIIRTGIHGLCVAAETKTKKGFSYFPFLSRRIGSVITSVV